MQSSRPSHAQVNLGEMLGLLRPLRCLPYAFIGAMNWAAYL